MTLTPKKLLLMFVLSLACGSAFLSAQSSGQAQLRQAVTTFGQAQYDQSLRLFRNIILDSSLGRYHGDSYFWIAKSYLALRQYDDASRNLEFFLSEYPDHSHYPEGLYQRGRLLFLQTQYETAIQVLEGFITKYQESPFTANSYYWIGESLYALGHFDEALEIYELVVDDFPTSFKVEAARYRVSLIELKERERELLKLLKWSHEEYLRALEDFDRRERSYEQALIAYQRTIRGYEDGTSDATRVTLLEEQVTSLQEQITSYQAQLAEVETTAPATVVEESSTQAEILELKEKALDLKSFYLLWLSAL